MGQPRANDEGVGLVILIILLALVVLGAFTISSTKPLYLLKSAVRESSGPHKKTFEEHLHDFDSGQAPPGRQLEEQRAPGRFIDDYLRDLDDERLFPEQPRQEEKKGEDPVRLKGKWVSRLYVP